MRLVVLGGTRFIGAAAVRSLCALGHEVGVVSRSAVELPIARRWRCLRSELDRILPEVRAFAPDVVIDAIAFSQADAEQSVRSFTGIARRSLVLSSCDVYRAYDRLRRIEPGEPDPQPMSEDSPLRSRLFPFRPAGPEPGTSINEYEKILVERAFAAQNDLPTTVLRLPMVHGPGDYQHRVSAYLKRMDDGRPAILLERGLAAWRAPRGYVEDMAQAIVRCALDERGVGRVYHVAEPASSEAEWVARIARAAGWSGRIVAADADDLPPALRHPFDTAQHWSLDSSRIRAELGYAETVDADEAMSRTVAWEREHPAAQVDAAEFDYAAEDQALCATAARA